MKILFFIPILILCLASCKKDNVTRKMDPHFFPTDMLFEDLKIDRFSFKIPDADFKTGPATFTVKKNGTDWSGFAISNKNFRSFVSKESALDSTKFSAFTSPTVHAGGNFLVVHPKDDDAQINFSQPLHPEKMLITPTTFLYQSMTYGDSTTTGGQKYYTWAHGTRMLTTARQDFVKVIVKGFNGSVSTGQVEYYLADRWSNEKKLSYIISEWMVVDLSSLGEVTKLVFTIESSVILNGQMTTPAYFCIDGFRFKENVY